MITGLIFLTLPDICFLRKGCIDGKLRRLYTFSMFGKIGIEKLSVMTVIGVYPFERKERRELIIDLKVKVELTACIKSDAIADALNYELLAFECQKIGEETSFNLIESYAAKVVGAIKERFPVSWVWIRVKKPDALPNTTCAFVELEG